MESVEVTTMTSRGQIVIPQAIREALELGSGAKFVVVGDGDTIILKKIGGPSIEELQAMLAHSRQAAKEKGIKKSDVQSIINKVRKSR